jgi:hypothetical protein
LTLHATNPIDTAKNANFITPTRKESEWPLPP